MAITSFSGKYRFLSNFLGGVEFAYQAAKTRDEIEIAEIMSSRSPAEAKKIGRRVTLRDDWDDIKDNVMYKLVKAKFEHPDYRKLLLETGDEEIVEGNWWGDTYWGMCNGVGQNKLGKILMRVRDEARSAA